MEDSAGVAAPSDPSRVLVITGPSGTSEREPPMVTNEDMLAYVSQELMIPKLFGGVTFWKKDFDALLESNGEYTNDIIDAFSQLIRHHGDIHRKPFRRDYLFSP